MSDEKKAEVAVLPKATVGRKNKVRKRIVELKKLVEDSYFEIGELLYEVFYAGYWKGWEYESFKQYVMDELGFHERKAQYLINIYKNLVVKAQVEPEKLEGVGWSKAKEIATVVDKDNADEWVERAKESTVTELVSDVREAKAERGESNTGGTVERSHRLSFTLFDSQNDNVEAALKLASQIAESEKRGHLLDCIATSFQANVLGDRGESKRVSEMMRVVESLERTFGVKIIVIDPKSQKPLYGEEHVPA
jgi:hypothetical protein